MDASVTLYMQNLHANPNLIGWGDWWELWGDHDEPAAQAENGTMENSSLLRRFQAGINGF